jgi:hypothetical protein
MKGHPLTEEENNKKVPLNFMSREHEEAEEAGDEEKWTNDFDQ